MSASAKNINWESFCASKKKTFKIPVKSPLSLHQSHIIWIFGQHWNLYHYGFPDSTKQNQHKMLGPESEENKPRSSASSKLVTSVAKNQMLLVIRKFQMLLTIKKKGNICKICKMHR